MRRRDSGEEGVGRLYKESGGGEREAWPAVPASPSLPSLANTFIS